MESITETCVVPVPMKEVFGFLSRIENLPEWSTQFVRQLLVVEGKYKALTPLGEVFIRLETNPDAGLINIYAGPTEEKMSPAYMRVIPISESSTGVMFTFFKWAGTDEAEWEAYCKSIKIEVGNIYDRFS
ncbi:MAG TPA: hypothetical protein VJ792_01000 [Candidatus Nitrosotalea sp.]|nr:hypothetical protein [Candidatus Nitrosotalea sp.]